MTKEITPNQLLAQVRNSWCNIKDLPSHLRTPEVCLAAVQQDGRAIEYLTLEQRTHDVCLAAVGQMRDTRWTDSRDGDQFANQPIPDSRFWGALP